MRPFTLSLFAAFSMGFATVAYVKSHGPRVAEITPIANYSLTVPAMQPAQPIQQAMVFDYRDMGRGVSANPRPLDAGQVAVVVPAVSTAVPTVETAAPATLAEIAALQDVRPAAGVVDKVAATVQPAPRALLQRTGTPRVAIVIDDIGPNYRESAAVIALPQEITLAFLPYAEKFDALVRRAQAQGHEMIVHMPMEPENMRSNNPGPNALTLDLAPEEIRARVSAALDRLPAGVGLNNHMGSRFTASAAGMQVVAEELAKRDLLFLDSRTTPQSVGIEMATAHSLRFAGRDVFLDNEADVDVIEMQLRTLERLARVQGHAIAIGHPYPETIAALKAWLPGAKERGIEIVPLSRLAKRMGMVRASTAQ